LNSLNRTSVGLKPVRPHRLLLDPGLPQSNQRGIETRTRGSAERGDSEPQSNQRGIETSPATGWRSPRPASLNRTSVGLKPETLAPQVVLNPRLNRTSVGLKRAFLRRLEISFAPPQSNQRGIETDVKHMRRRREGAPQSNQRGIETSKGGEDATQWQSASIEPAWD